MTREQIPEHKRAAYDVLLRQAERIGERWHATVDEQWLLMEERHDFEQLWRNAGFGEPPEFRPMRNVPRTPEAA